MVCEEQIGLYQTGRNGAVCSKVGKQNKPIIGLKSPNNHRPDDLIVSFGAAGVASRSLMKPRFFRAAINQRKSIGTQALATSGGASAASGASGAAEIRGGGSPMGGFASGTKPMGTLASRFLTKWGVYSWPKLFGTVMRSAKQQLNL